MLFKRIFVFSLLNLLTNIAMATNYSLPPDFVLEEKTDALDSSLVTIMPPPAIINSVTPKIKPAFKLSLNSHSKSYRVGESISFTIKSNQACYLTVLDIGTTGQTTVLFPNSYRKDNYIKADSNILLPSEAVMPVETLFIGKPENSMSDTETVIAICRTSKKPLFKQPYQFNDYNFRIFERTDKWQQQLTGIAKEQEARAKISFDPKPALENGN